MIPMNISLPSSFNLNLPAPMLSVEEMDDFDPNCQRRLLNF